MNRELLMVPCPKCGRRNFSLASMFFHDRRCWSLATAVFNICAVLGLNTEINHALRSP